MKVTVVYWSGTGNTQAMAEAVAQGAQSAGAQVQLLTADAFGPEQLENDTAYLFGCPAMGAEVLEEDEFDPMFTRCECGLSGKNVALFGSYGWGDGEWMRSWEARCAADGMVLVADSVICQDAPDEETLARCRALGQAAAKRV